MHNLLNKLRNKSNYYFPLDSYRGEKITDLPWIRLFIPFAPYSALLLCGVIFLWGILGHPNKPFFLTPQGPIGIIAAFWSAVFIVISRKLKEKRRSPAVALLIANFLPLYVFLGLFLTTGFTSTAKMKLATEKAEFSRLVQSKIQENRDFVRAEFASRENKFKEDFQKTRETIREIATRADNLPEMSKRFKQKFEETWKLRDRQWAEFSSKMWENLDKSSKQLEERQRKERLQWHIDHKMLFFLTKEEFAEATAMIEKEKG